MLPLLEPTTTTHLVDKPMTKQDIAKLKKTMEPFLQYESCSIVAPKLTKCRECKIKPTQRNEKQSNIFCRFYAFRRFVMRCFMKHLIFIIVKKQS